METSQNKNINVNEVLGNKDIDEAKSDNEENIENEIRTCKDSMKETSINKDIHENETEDKDIHENETDDKDIHVNETEDKYIRNKIETSQNEDSDVEKISKDRDESEGENITNKMEISQIEDKDVKKALKNKRGDESETESDDESIEEEQCSEVTYLARLMASAEKLNQSDSMKLYNIHVKLRHAVPPQHRIETRAGSHMPTREEIKKFEKIISIKKGLYSDSEDTIIARNWNAFCKLHHWNADRFQPFLQLRVGRITHMRNTMERRRFVQFLADGLPNRTLYSVYHRFRNLYVDNVQRRYKPEEDEMILSHLENNPSLDEKRKYVDLAKVLRRTRNSIWRRYRLLKKERQKT